VKIPVERIAGGVVRGVFVSQADSLGVVGEEKVMFDSNRVLIVVAKVGLPVVRILEGVIEPGQSKLFIHGVEAGTQVLDAAEIVPVHDVVNKFIVQHEIHKRVEFVHRAKAEHLRSQVVLVQLGVDGHIDVVVGPDGKFIGERALDQTAGGPLKHVVVLAHQKGWTEQLIGGFIHHIVIVGVKGLQLEFPVLAGLIGQGWRL